MRKFSSLEDMRTTQIADWQRLAPAARRQAAWEMVVDAWELKKRNSDELRLQRSITSVRKA